MFVCIILLIKNLWFEHFLFFKKNVAIKRNVLKALKERYF